MGWQWRVAILSFVLIYRIFLPGLETILHPSVAPLEVERLILDILFEVVLFAPVMFYRPEWGWLHPLLFPPIFGLAKGLAAAPGQLLAPLALFTERVYVPLSHPALRLWSQEDIAAGMVEAKLVLILALLCYYFAFFFGVRMRVPRFRALAPRDVDLKALVVVGLSLAVFVVFMQMRGGIVSHLVSFGIGRFRALGGMGHITVLIMVGTTAALVWWALDERAGRKPWFWAAAAYAIPLSFVISGSRSSVIGAAVMFLMVWMIRHQKVPTARVMLLAVTGIFSIGMLGALRESTMKGAVDWSIVTDLDVTALVSAGRTEMAQRSEGGAFVPVVAKVPKEVDFLYGRSYVGTLLFFVPRAIWSEKPRGVGPMTNAYIYQGIEMREGQTLSGAGIPPGAAGEAYWNFWYPGVILVYLAYGMFHWWLAALLRQNAEVPAAWVIYVLSLWMTPTGTSLMDWAQALIPALALLWWMGALEVRKERVAPRYAVA
jgi:hypothetical protein